MSRKKSGQAGRSAGSRFPIKTAKFLSGELRQCPSPLRNIKTRDTMINIVSLQKEIQQCQKIQETKTLLIKQL